MQRVKIQVQIPYLHVYRPHLFSQKYLCKMGVRIYIVLEIFHHRRTVRLKTPDSINLDSKVIAESLKIPAKGSN